MELLKRMQLTGRVAVITGGARNLGRAYAEGLAMAGAAVCIADISGEDGKKTAEEIHHAFGVPTTSFAVDVTKPEAVEALMAHTVKELGCVDICVANAGIFIEATGEALTPKVWNQVLDVNLTGAWYTCQAAARTMIAQGRGGSIIATTSISAHRASKAPCCAYSASKGGLLSAIQDMATEWGAYGIRVNSISPGNMNTIMLSPEWRTKNQKACEDNTVLGRLGEPDELQGAVVYLAGDASSYTTGAEIVVDGGYLVK